MMSDTTAEDNAFITAEAANRNYLDQLKACSYALTDEVKKAFEDAKIAWINYQNVRNASV